MMASISRFSGSMRRAPAWPRYWTGSMTWIIVRDRVRVLGPASVILPGTILLRLTPPLAELGPEAMAGLRPSAAVLITLVHGAATEHSMRLDLLPPEPQAMAHRRNAEELPHALHSGRPTNAVGRRRSRPASSFMRCRSRATRRGMSSLPRSPVHQSLPLI